MTTTTTSVTAHPTGATAESLIIGRDLHRRFGQTVALDGASVEIVAGEVVALMGPSGSGKSTLLHCLAGILKPDEGEVHYRGSRIDTLSDEIRSRLRRDDFGFVFQFGQLVPELSVIENVTLPIRLGGVNKRQAEQRAREWLDRLEVADVETKRPGEISGGQSQRVAVARALITGPRVVFADEPTGSLDSLNGELVMTLLVDTARKQGATVVLVTHEPRVAAYADREVVVRDGRCTSPVAVW
jgi:putative ABC transport system ATP-binding protein